jgi:hypothetical protein
MDIYAIKDNSLTCNSKRKTIIEKNLPVPTYQTLSAQVDGMRSCERALTFSG